MATGLSLRPPLPRQAQKPHEGLRTISPTDLVGEWKGAAQAGTHRAKERGSRRAAAFGQLVHALLRRKAELGEQELRRWAAAEAEDLGLDARHAEDALRLVGRCASAVLRRAEAAGHALREVPFAVNVEGVCLGGTADLAFLEDDAWVIVDYKTDDITAREVDDRAKWYRPQGLAYALGLSRSTGMPVKEVVFVFLRAGTERAVAYDPSCEAEVLRAIREITSHKTPQSLPTPE